MTCVRPVEIMQNTHISEGTTTLTAAELGKRVEVARLEAGLTQEDLAWGLGITQPTVDRMEAGHGISSLRLAQIAKLTQHPLDFFLRPPVASVLLRADDSYSRATRRAIEMLNRFVTDYEFLLELDQD